MSFPDDDMDTELVAAFGADLTAAPSTWAFTDLSSRLIQGPIQISPGVVLGGGTQKAASATGILCLNDDGALTPFHPSSPYYPSVDVGTPARLSIRTNTTPYASDTFGRTVAAGSWGTTTSGKLWDGASSIYSVSGGKGLITFPAANALAHTRIPLTHRDLEMQWDQSIAAVSTGASTLVGATMRINASSTAYLWAGVEFGVGGAVQLSLRQYAGGVQVASDSVVVAGLTYTAGAALRCKSAAFGDRWRVKAWLAAGVEPEWQIEVGVTDPALLVSATNAGFRSWIVAGNSNTLPNPMSIDNVEFRQPRYPRIEGYITDVKPTFRVLADGQTHSVAQITLGGIGTRLERRQASELSPLRRSIEKSTVPPLAYWPLEDNSGATSGASAYPAQPPMVVTGPAVFAFDRGDTDDNLISKSGTAAMCSLAAGAKLASSVPASTSTSWTVSLMQQSAPPFVGGGLVEMRIMEWATPAGTFQRWALVGLAAGGYRVRAYNDAAGTTTDVATYSATFTDLVHMSVWVSQSGGNIAVQLIVNGVSIASGSVAGTSAPVTRISINPDQTNTTNSTSPLGIKLLVGHVSIHDSIFGALPYYGDGTYVVRGDRAWAYEMAHRRVSRLCTEERIPCTILGDPESTGPTRLNAQQSGAFVSLARQAADSESGALLLEGRFGYVMDPRTTRYNRAVALTVDMSTYCYSQGTNPEDILVPTLDARGPNIWTVERTNGSEATVAAPDAFLERRGEVREKATLDVLYDSDTAQHAGWRTHLSVDGQGANYPNMTLDLAANPDLIDDWLSCRVGSRMQRLNQPLIAGLGVIDQIIDGFTETITPRQSGGPAWTAQLDTSPAAVWDVGIYDSGQRYDSASTTLGLPVNTTTTLLHLLTADLDDVWDIDDLPYDITIAGQDNRVVWMSSIGSAALAEGGFETGVSGWSAVGGSIAASTAFAFLGSGSARLTVSGSPATAYIYNSSLWAVGGSYPYTAMAWIYSVAGVSNVRMTISWYNGSAVFISSSSSSPISVPAGVWTQVTVSATSPGTAAFAFVLPNLTSSPANGTVIYIDEVDMTWDGQIDYSPIEQRAWVVRGVNGVTKALPVNSEVHIANPGYWGL